MHFADKCLLWYFDSGDKWKQLRRCRRQREAENISNVAGDTARSCRQRIGCGSWSWWRTWWRVSWRVWWSTHRSRHQSWFPALWTGLLRSPSLLLLPFTVLLSPCQSLLLPARGTTSTATLHRTRQISSITSSPTDPRVLVLLCWLKSLLPLREGMSGRMTASITTTTLAGC